MRPQLALNKADLTLKGDLKVRVIKTGPIKRLANKLRPQRDANDVAPPIDVKEKMRG